MEVKKEKLHIEYPLARLSKFSLWNCLSTAGGMAEWFADDVTDNGKVFVFTWGKHQAEAELIGMNPFNYVRFHWLDDDDDSYFEFRLHKIELTGEWMLEITDFAEEEEKEQAITLWNTQIKALKRRLGL
ncbi:MAG: hypothetical protein LBB85_11980 [Dysgonamonadaceae bacterium]|jgi:hypothetical protein|nr:hypothetical protein [Dysgonamonadaceae bacterium]